MTRNLGPNQFVVYENTISGTDKVSKEALFELVDQESNTRLLGISAGVLIYNLGENFYDREKTSTSLQENRSELESLNSALDTLGESPKLEKKIYKLSTKIQSLEKKLEYGNGLMRTGNPLVILDSTLTQKTVNNMKGYLVNHGFFEGDVQYQVQTKKKKAFVDFQIEENSLYVLDSVYTRTDNPAIIQLLNSSQNRSLIQAGQPYNQDLIIEERTRIEDLLKNNGFYMFSKSYINYFAYQDTSAKTIKLEQVIQKPTFAERHQVYTLDSILFRINPPSEEFADRQIQEKFREIDFSF